MDVCSSVSPLFYCYIQITLFLYVYVPDFPFYSSRFTKLFILFWFLLSVRTYMYLKKTFIYKEFTLFQNIYRIFLRLELFHVRKIILWHINALQYVYTHRSSILYYLLLLSSILYKEVVLVIISFFKRNVY